MVEQRRDSSRASSHDGSRPSEGGNPNLNACGPAIAAEHNAQRTAERKVERAAERKVERAAERKVELDGSDVEVADLGGVLHDELEPRARRPCPSGR